MYSGYLESFYRRHTETSGMSYSDHLDFLLADTTEFVASYLRNFRKLGVQNDCIISNDDRLQTKWAITKGIDPEKKWDILFDQIDSFRPDIILIENLRFVNNEFLIRVRNNIPGLKIITANHCSPFSPKVLDSLKGVDFVFTCTPGLKESIEKMGIRSYLIYHGFDSDQLKRLEGVTVKAENGLVFSGSLITGGNFHAKRINLIERILKENLPIELYVDLEKGYRIRIKQSIYYFSQLLKLTGLKNIFKDSAILQYGSSKVSPYSKALLKKMHPPVFGIDMLELFMKSGIVLNFHIGIAGDYAGNIRMFEATGAGSCLLTDNKKNMPDLFEIGKEVIVYDSEDDCIEKIKWLLDHEEERNKIAMAGKKRTLNHHTVANRCEAIATILKDELGKLSE
jgi:spore maturation protein CgeB